MPDTHTRTQHTPGPWQWFADVEEQRVELWGNADVQGDDPIATVYATDLIAADHDPNLRLIAAAPTMADAILAAIRYGDFSGSPETLDMLKDAARNAGVM